MADHPIEKLMDTAMTNIKSMVDVNTIVGDAVQAPDGTVIIPISKVSFGFAAGGGDYSPENATRGEGEEGEKRLPFAGGSGAGVSINPETPVEVLDEILPFVDLVLIMSVHPGFCGQKFMDEVVSKIKYLEKARHSRELSFSIEIDGGVNLNNVTTVIDAGADILVAGSSVFGAKDIEKRVKEFKKLI